MIKAVVIDDEENARAALINLIGLCGTNIEVVAQADGVQSGIEIILQHQPQLVFLDINMDDGTGFDLLKKLDKINFKLIFVTAYEEFAVKAFKFSALDYLLKPINPDELIAAIQTAEKVITQSSIQSTLDVFLTNLEKPKQKPKKIVLKSSNDLHIVNVEDITRCESDGNYTNFFLDNGQKIMVSKTLKDYEDILTEHGFVRLHHSHLVNINFIERLNKSAGDIIIMKDKSEVPVSSRKKEYLLKLLDKL